MSFLGCSDDPELRQGSLWELGLEGTPAPPPPQVGRAPAQIALPLAWPAAPRDDEFVVTASNMRAVEVLEGWRGWAAGSALLTGPRKSGRSLLARIWAAKSGGALIDAVDSLAESDVFHALNRVQAEGRPLLLIADAAPPAWAVRLPDLRTRLAAISIAAIGAPDDALMRALFERHLLRRGLDARGELIDWLVPRLERSHLALLRVVDVLDQAAFEAHRRMTIPLARNALQSAALIAADA